MSRVVLLVHLAILSFLTGKANYFTQEWNSILLFLVDAFRNNAEECCQTGRIQAESTKECTTTLQSLVTDNAKNVSTNCRFLTHICCLANLRHHYCDEGIKTALRLLPCNETKLESKDTYQV